MNHLPKNAEMLSLHKEKQSAKWSRSKTIGGIQTASCTRKLQKFILLLHQGKIFFEKVWNFQTASLQSAEQNLYAFVRLKTLEKGTNHCGTELIFIHRLPSKPSLRYTALSTSQSGGRSPTGNCMARQDPESNCPSSRRCRWSTRHHWSGRRRAGCG